MLRTLQCSIQLRALILLFWAFSCHQQNQCSGIWSSASSIKFIQCFMCPNWNWRRDQHMRSMSPFLTLNSVVHFGSLPLSRKLIPQILVHWSTWLPSVPLGRMNNQWSVQAHVKGWVLRLSMVCCLGGRHMGRKGTFYTCLSIGSGVWFSSDDDGGDFGSGELVSPRSYCWLLIYPAQHYRKHLLMLQNSSWSFFFHQAHPMVP